MTRSLTLDEKRQVKKGGRSARVSVLEGVEKIMGMKRVLLQKGDLTNNRYLFRWHVGQKCTTWGLYGKISGVPVLYKRQ